MKLSHLLVAMVCCLGLAVNAYAGPRYTAVQVGGASATGAAVNDNGVVVGGYQNESGEWRAFVWSSSAGLQELGILNGYIASSARDINNNGTIVGECYTAGASEYAAFLYTSANGMQDIGNLGGTFTRAEGINEAGQVVGESSLAAGNDAASHAFVWTEAGGMVDMVGAAFGDDNSSSYAINDSGVATLYKHAVSADMMTSTRTAYIWDNTNGPQSLGAFPQDQNESLDINANSMVVGYYGAPMGMNRSAFSWTVAGGVVTLPQPASLTSATAAAVNDDGIIVGYGNDASWNSFPLLWIGGEVFDLNDVTELENGWTLQFAYDINTSGQIVCTGVVNGQSSTFLLTPDTDCKLTPIRMLLLD